jgi:hypothetical protein
MPNYDDNFSYLRTAVFQRHAVREELIIGFIATVRLYIYYILQRILALHGHHQVKCLHSLSALLLFSPTLGNVYKYEGNALFQ